jgi:nucleotide-binding universal stress UspA family protein
MAASLYRHMLFAADYDAAHEAALLDKVAGLRAALGAELSLVHVVDGRGLHAGGTPVTLPRHHDDTVAEASTNITTTAALVPHDRDALTDGADDFLRQVAGRLGVDASRCHAVENDSVRDAIIDTAGRVGADLIVLGHGSRHWYSWFTASVAQGVLGRAPCDVLVIHLQD